MRFLISFIFCLFSFLTISQDTIKELTLENYLQQIKENHPYAIIANNQVEQAKLMIQQSKGAFDPVAYSGIDQKYYDGKMYYSTLTSGVKIPTRLGVDFKLAGDWNRGYYLNDENKVPDGGLTYLGIEVPVGRGMLTDERRTQLKRSQLALNQSYLEQKALLNDLLYEAGQQFINLQEQIAQLSLAENGFELAQLRYQQLKTEAEIGEKAFIDTVEASAQLYLRQIDVQQRKLNVQNAYLAIEIYLWDKGLIPLKLDSSLRIQSIEKVNYTIDLNQDVSLNPNLQMYSVKISDLDLERKLKIEQLKPQLNLNYNLLQTPNDLLSMNYDFRNYKWGASFYMPLFLRKERAALQQTKLKIENTNLQQNYKQRELETKLKQNQQTWSTNIEQVQTSKKIADRYFQMAEAERNFFSLGESTLFLVNAREISYLSAQSKYVEMLAKSAKIRLSDLYIKGLLQND